MKEKKTKRMIGIVLALVMVVSLFPMSNLMVFAEGESITVAVDSSSTSYSPTTIINGSFDSRPWMDFTYNGRTYTNATTSKSDNGTVSGKYPSSVVYNGIGEGWNTTEPQIQMGGVFFDVGHQGSSVWLTDANGKDVYAWGIVKDQPQSYGYAIELNATHTATVYQDLATHGGDVIRWRLKHQARNSGDSEYTQEMQVNIGAPNRDENGQIVYAYGTGNNINVEIENNTIFKSTGVLPTDGCGYANLDELTGLKLIKSQNAWYDCTGIYIIPEEQNVTRFAFQSIGASNCAAGNLLDEIEFSTLIGNLKAVFQDDGSVNVTGYWGETDTSKKFVIKIGDTPYEIDMSGVASNSNHNFVANIPASMIGSATFVEVYHQDYAVAKKTVEIEHVHNWTYSAEGAVITAKCSGVGACTVPNGKDTGVQLTFSASSPTYFGSEITKATLFEGMDFTAFNSATGNNLSKSDIKLYSANDTSNELTSINEAGSYVAKLTVGGATATCTVTVNPNIPHTCENGVTNAVTLTITGGTIPAGSYYLRDDFTLTSQLIIAEGDTVNICLNDKILNLNEYQIQVEADATLNIYDCGSTPKYFNESNGLWIKTSEVTTKVVNGGVISGGKGKISDGNASGGAISSFGEVNINNANLVGNYCNFGGGAIYTSGDLKISGSKLCGNVSDDDGGAICADDAKIEIHNSEISIILQKTEPAFIVLERVAQTQT